MEHPRSFGRYEILGKLGEGAMGVVYRAQDTALGRVVALKMLSADLGEDDEIIKRFLREAEAIGRMNHPNIVTVYDRGETEGHLFMAMELLEGEDLRAFIENPSEVPLADRGRIMAQIAEGLGYAHSHGVVHRDVKPANIIVDGTGQVKLLDFGLARLATHETITRKGVILGTPDYMSPEQAKGLPADHRSDMFSAGAVFYEVLTGQKPFPGRTLQSVLYQIISLEPDAVLTLDPDIPGRLAAVVHRMLRKDPAKRYASMDEVAGELWGIHASLRRSRSRSALPPRDPRAAPIVTQEARSRVREHLAKGRAHLLAGRADKAEAEMSAALSLDPDCAEAAEALWRSGRRSPLPLPPPPRLITGDVSRVEALLSKLAPGSSDDEARRALAELALVAPDHPRLAEILRERAGRDRIS